MQAASCEEAIPRRSAKKMGQAEISLKKLAFEGSI